MSPAEAGNPVQRLQPAHLRVRLGPGDVACYLWRAKWLMLLVFVPLFALGLAGALMMPERYTATARIVLMAEAGAVAQAAEVELLRSPEVLEAVLEEIPLARSWPHLARRCQGAACDGMGRDALLASLLVSPQQGGRAIELGLTHSDPLMAGDILRAWSRAYLDYRPAILAEEPALTYEAQRERFEQDVVRAEEAIRAYLVKNGLANLEAERATLNTLYGAAHSQMLTASARKAEISAELAIWRERAADLPAERQTRTQDSGRETLQKLYQSREQMRARLAYDAPELRAVEEDIARLERRLAAQGGPSAGLRLSPNPLWQEAQSAIARLEAEARSVRQQEAELNAQLDVIRQRQLALLELAPGLEALQRRRDAAADGARRYAGLAAEARARGDMARSGGGGVQLVGPVNVPVRGESLRLAAALGAFLAALAAALAAGLVYATTRKGFASVRALERTLGLPVLAVVPKRGRSGV